MVNTLHLPVHKKFTKNFCEGITYIELNNIFPITLFFMCCPLLSFANPLCSLIIFSVCKASQPQLTIPCVSLHLLHHRQPLTTFHYKCCVLPAPLCPFFCVPKSIVSEIIKNVVFLCL